LPNGSGSSSFVGELLISFGALIIIFLGNIFSLPCFTVTPVGAPQQTICEVTTLNLPAIEAGIVLLIFGALFIILKHTGGSTRGH